MPLLIIIIETKKLYVNIWIYDELIKKEFEMYIQFYEIEQYLK